MEYSRTVKAKHGINAAKGYSYRYRIEYGDIKYWGFFGKKLRRYRCVVERYSVIGWHLYLTTDWVDSEKQANIDGENILTTIEYGDVS